MELATERLVEDVIDFSLEHIEFSTSRNITALLSSQTTADFSPVFSMI